MSAQQISLLVLEGWHRHLRAYRKADGNNPFNGITLPLPFSMN
ncbi:hypothetical protein [Pantoea rwandensis]|nr:hypothetical protein [Pantoea rwandensis]